MPAFLYVAAIIATLALGDAFGLYLGGVFNRRHAQRVNPSQGRTNLLVLILAPFLWVVGVFGAAMVVFHKSIMETLTDNIEILVLTGLFVVAVIGGCYVKRGR
jgi:drug/metabolite transporter (DMT)-like permease